MTLVVFQKQEAGYFKWLKAHPEGFVLNTRAGLSPSYMKLHRASCKLVTGYLGKAEAGGFTERSYRKICAEEVPSISTWVVQNGGNLTSCAHCKPEQDQLRALERDLYARTKKALADTTARRARLGTAAKKPMTAIVKTTVYLRNPDVVAEVLHRAKGKCERCGALAPFLRRDGTPYLEVHHIKLLSQGGDDTPENAQAQCPNCHRESHFGANAVED